MLSPVYAPLSLRVRQAKGVWIEADEGTFLDAYAGIGVMTFGHSWEPSVTAARAQMERYAHLSNYFRTDEAVQMAEALCRLDGRAGSVYFSNSGAEATEAALKAVVKVGRPGAIVSFRGNFHGRTCGALSLTWGPAIREPYNALTSPVVFLEPTARALADYRRTNDVAALWVEPIQGSGGVVPMDDRFMAEVTRAQADGALLVTDEIQSGLGRTGAAWAYQGWKLKPDVVTAGKGLGGGLPLGAALFYGFEPFGPGDHGSTFAPNPVALAAGLPVVRAQTEEAWRRVRTAGVRLSEGLAKLPWCRTVRGRGLMLAALADDPIAVRAEAFKRGALLNVTGGVLRFLPALNITDGEIDELLSRLEFQA